jgi:serine/threonine protein kinase
LGLSSTVTRDKDSANSIGASKWWASPEQILAAPCTTKADVFGLGTVIWELCTGETITERYLRPLRVPEEAPQEIEDLICACRANSAQDRPTAAEIHATITSSAAKVAP